MVSQTIRLICLSTLLLSLAIVHVTPGKIIYVDADADGAHNGSSWADAYNYLQDALADANSAEKLVEIRVAEGVYTPDSNSAEPNGSGNQQATFQLMNNVAVKGGYAGFGQPDPNACSVTTHETILSGDLDGNDVEVSDACDLGTEPSRGENSFHVITASRTDLTSILDGFTITGGNAASWPGNMSGGGMYNTDGSPTLTNCTFTANSAKGGGGAMYNQARFGSCRPALTKCRLTRNAAEDGGAVFNATSSPRFTQSIFIGNFARWSGGGMCNVYDSHITLTRCTFNANSVVYWGGAMYNSDSSPTLQNCTFSGNRATMVWSNGGAMLNASASSPTLLNCTLTANYAYQGGGIYNGRRECNPTLNNCIVWGNTEWSPFDDVVQIRYGTPVITYCCIQDWNAGLPSNGNINANPRFADPGAWVDGSNPKIIVEAYDPNAIWIDGDYHLKSQARRWDLAWQSWVLDRASSPCIDAGDPNSDWTAEFWPHGKRINMGAFGGTAQASMSLSSIGSIADLNNDGSVDHRDMTILPSQWLRQEILLRGDLDRNGWVGFVDFCILADNWLWEE